MSTISFYADKEALRIINEEKKRIEERGYKFNQSEFICKRIKMKGEKVAN
ncbi:MAG: hypothetical protein ACTSR3_01325 [Candidatus Helarchaeota archaeon]